jgi:ATP-binding cassette subfamily B protein
MPNIFRILKIAKPYRRYIILLALLIVFSVALEQAGPIMLKFIVDEIGLQVTSKTGNLGKLYQLIALSFALNLFAVLISVISERLGDYISGRLGKYLTEIFYRKIFTLPQKYFDSEVSGKIINQLTRGISSIQDFISTSSNFVVPALLQSIFTIAILAYYNLAIGLLALAIFPIYVIISGYSTKRWGKEEVKKNAIEDKTRGRIQEVIANIKLVKGFNTQKQEWNLVSNNQSQIVSIYDKQSTSYHALNFLRNFGLETILIIIGVIVFGNTFKGILTLGEMVLILQFLNQLRRPLFAMSFILERVQKAESGSKEFFDILNLESNESFNVKASKAKITNPEIEFKQVAFAYQPENPVLKDISFHLHPEQTVALVGHSGAGKSTIVNLIMKFYEPTAGEILINKQPYAKLDHQTIRAAISLVFQENELFSATIRDNVAYGMPDATDKQIIQALEKANAYSFVTKLPGGLNAEVGERGVKLSGGQKQRIQIARAILHNTPILILDEATSSLDSKSEKLVQDALEELTKKRLTIIIAHRFSTIQNADQILVIDDGKLIDSGSPKELARKPGIYSELLKYQIEGNKKLLSEYELY